MHGPRPILFSAHRCADYSKYRGFLAGSISTASSLLPFLEHGSTAKTLISHPHNTASYAGYRNSANKRYLLYGKASLRQIRALWLVLARSGFCSTDRVHGNGPRRVFLFWSKAGNFKIAIRTAKKKMWTLSFFIAKLPEKAKKIEILLRFQRWMKKTNILLASSVLS